MIDVLWNSAKSSTELNLSNLSLNIGYYILEQKKYFTEIYAITFFH